MVSRRPLSLNIPTRTADGYNTISPTSIPVPATPLKVETKDEKRISPSTDEKDRSMSMSSAITAATASGSVEDVSFMNCDESTPRQRASRVCLEHLNDVISGIDDIDLESLLKIRELVDARCKVLAEAASRSSAEQANMLPNVDLVDDGNKTPSSSAKIGDWDIGSDLGAGRYGKVFNAKNRVTKKLEAVKVIVKTDVCSKEDWLNTCSEHASLCKIGQHPNIAGLTGALQSKERVYFFMVFVKGKDLFDFLKVRQQSKKEVPKEAISQIFSSIARALACCHACGICHRDMKPENIIVQQDYTAKLIDFGCACPRLELRLQCVGTMPFIAPEFLCGTAVDGAPADVWSLGIVLLEMLHGLRSLSKALGWDANQTSTEECGAQLSTCFADPVQGLAHVRTSLGVNTQFEGDAVLASTLHASPTQRPSAETLCLQKLLG